MNRILSLLMIFWTHINVNFKTYLNFILGLTFESIFGHSKLRSSERIEFEAFDDGGDNDDSVEVRAAMTETRNWG